MNAFGKKLRRGEGGRTTFHCPGCDCNHTITVAGPHAWGFNGDGDRPTFTPSVLVQGVKQMTREQEDAYRRGEGLPPAVPFVCHSFVTDGRIQFLTDCTHALAGQTVDLPDYPSNAD